MGMKDSFQSVYTLELHLRIPLNHRASECRAVLLNFARVSVHYRKVSPALRKSIASPSLQNSTSCVHREKRIRGESPRARTPFSHFSARKCSPKLRDTFWIAVSRKFIINKRGARGESTLKRRGETIAKKNSGACVSVWACAF